MQRFEGSSAGKWARLAGTQRHVTTWDRAAGLLYGNARQAGDENRTRDAQGQPLPDEGIAQAAGRPGEDEIVQASVAIFESVAASLAVRFRSIGQFGQRENLSGIVQERGACSLRDRQPCEKEQPEQCLRDETMKAGSGQGSVHPSETCSTAADTLLPNPAEGVRATAAGRMLLPNAAAEKLTRSARP